MTLPNDNPIDLFDMDRLTWREYLHTYNCRTIDGSDDNFPLEKTYQIPDLKKKSGTRAKEDEETDNWEFVYYANLHNKYNIENAIQSIS